MNQNSKKSPEQKPIHHMGPSLDVKPIMAYDPTKTQGQCPVKYGQTEDAWLAQCLYVHIICPRKNYTYETV